MRSIALLVTLATASVASLAYGAAAEADVRATFGRYKAAVLAHDGVRAAAEIGEDTVAYYARLRTAALTAPDIHGLPLQEKLVVVRLRHELSPDQLDAMDGRMLLAHAIGKGWVPTAEVERQTLSTIEVSGPRAKATIMYGSKALPAKLSFKRERAGWRIDLMAFVEGAAPALEALRKKAGLSEDELVLKMVKEATGRAVPAGIWRPMAPPR